MSTESKNYRREYNARNKEIAREKAKQKVVCECGREVARSYFYLHKNSEQHKTWVRIQKMNF
jgi:hypothetical protein